MQQSTATPLIPAPDFSHRILDALKTALVCLDHGHCVTYVNATAEALLENSAASLVGKNFHDLLSRAEPSSIGERLSRGPAALTEHEAVITLASGKSFVADYSIYPCGEPDGETEVLLEIRVSERQSQFARDEFNQLQQQATQQLARGLAHEINNPLGGIRGAAQLLQRELDRADIYPPVKVLPSLSRLMKDGTGEGFTHPDHPDLAPLREAAEQR